MKVPLYKFNKNNDSVNALGENGWGLTISDERLLAAGVPVLISIEFEMPTDNDVYRNALAWLNKAANTNAENRAAMEKCGCKIKRVYSESEGKRVYRIENEDYVAKWRLEVNYSDDDFPYVYITFAHPLLSTPSIYNREIIDKYVPKEIIEKALSLNAIEPAEYEAEDA